MNDEFKEIILSTIQELKELGENNVTFKFKYDEEPDYVIAIMIKQDSSPVVTH